MNPVNKNLVGTGYLTTDQKKKLLWGKKKSTASEESAHRWDNASALIGDPERQEKFNKLMVNLILPSLRTCFASIDCFPTSVTIIM
jgi:hypothetical protein